MSHPAPKQPFGASASPLTAPEVIDRFTAAMRAAGIETEARIIADGQRHRFRVIGDKSGSENGWYVLHLDGLPAGAFGCWKRGTWETWCAKDKSSLSDAERRELSARIERQRQEQEAERQRVQAECKAKAERLWNEARQPTPDHPYLARKAIKPYGVRQLGDALLVPLRDPNGALVSLQFIQGDGAKKFLTGTPKAGNYHRFGNGAARVLICEGFATGASLHEATGCAVAVAFDCGNLLPVAQAIRAKLPDAELVICADDDRTNPANPGLTKARAAAQAVAGLLAVPAFAESEAGTDFNDLAQAQGLQAVADCVAAAVAPEAAILTGEAANDPAPIPLPGLPPVPPFDLDMLPESLRPYVEDVCDRASCPLDFVAVAAMVALSGALGCRRTVRAKLHDNWIAVPNLWGMIIGRPSSMKSPALAAATEPLRQIERDAAQAYKAAKQAYEIETRLHKLAAKDAEKAAATKLKTDPAAALACLAAHEQSAPEEPRRERLIVNDATVEKLQEIMADNPLGLVLVRDELAGWLQKLDAEEQSEARSFMLTAYSGKEPFTVDRIGRGTVQIPRACLAVIGGIQPARVSRLIRGAVSGQSDDGLLQRFQIVTWPNDKGDWQWRDRMPHLGAQEAYHATFRALYALTPSEEPLRQSEVAQGLFREWHEDLRKEAVSGDLHSAIESHLGKMPEAILSLALLIELADDPDAQEIGENAMTRALAWSDYLRAHVNRLYASESSPETAAARTILDKQRELPDGFTARDIQRKGWTGIDSKEVAREALDLLADHYYLHVRADHNGGRPTDRYFWTPGARK